MPCFMLRSTSLHAYIFRSTCFMLYAMFFYALFLFLFQDDVSITCLHACMMLLVMPCLDLCIYVFISMLQGQILVFTCLYAWIHVLPRLYARLLHVYMHVSMPICLDLCLHMPMCLDLCSLHALCHRLCACALYAMFVCLDLGRVCHAMCYCSPFVALSFFLVLRPNGQDLIQTLWSLSSSIHQGPYKRVWITSICMSILLCFMLVLASLVLGFAMLDGLNGFMVVWLHPTPMRPCLDVTIWDASP